MWGFVLASLMAFALFFITISAPIPATLAGQMIWPVPESALKHHHAGDATAAYNTRFNWDIARHHPDQFNMFIWGLLNKGAAVQRGLVVSDVQCLAGNSTSQFIYELCHIQSNVGTITVIGRFFPATAKWEVVSVH